MYFNCQISYEYEWSSHHVIQRWCLLVRPEARLQQSSEDLCRQPTHLNDKQEAHRCSKPSDDLPQRAPIRRRAQGRHHTCVVSIPATPSTAIERWLRAQQTGRCLKTSLTPTLKIRWLSKRSDSMIQRAQTFIVNLVDVSQLEV